MCKQAWTVGSWVKERGVCLLNQCRTKSIFFGDVQTQILPNIPQGMQVSMIFPTGNGHVPIHN